MSASMNLMTTMEMATMMMTMMMLGSLMLSLSLSLSLGFQKFQLRLLQMTSPRRSQRRQASELCQVTTTMMMA